MFKVGDIVKCVDSLGSIKLAKGLYYKVSTIDKDLIGVNDETYSRWHIDRFKCDIRTERKDKLNKIIRCSNQEIK